jgi:hypothetical protein
MHAWSNSAAEWTFIEFDIQEFNRKYVSAFQFQLKSDKYTLCMKTFVSRAELIKYLLKQCQEKKVLD